MNKITVAAIQTVSSTKVEDNLKNVTKLIVEASKQAQWVVLPEYWILMGQNDSDKCLYAESFGNGEIQSHLSNLAKEHNITLFAGTIPLRTNNHNKVYNSLLVFAPDGKCISRYDKIHLFGYSGVGERYNEADTIEAGTTIPSLIHQDWNIGQGICYDIRFPNFFIAQGIFDVLILPAAFTYTTGKDHWEILLRARAIENQCYLIAAAQGGNHENGRQTYGHSMIIDPWGKIICQANMGESIITANIDKTRINSVRRHLPSVFLLNNKQ